jgi:hypothetical protein
VKCLISSLIALSFWLVADGALACIRVHPQPRLGETNEQLFTRITAAEQLSDWRNSSLVYVARVTSVKRHKNDGHIVGFEPVKSIKGGKPPRLATWHDPSEAMCGTGHRWAAGETVVVFVEQISWRDSILRMGQWFVYGAYPQGAIVEPTVARALGGLLR